MKPILLTGVALFVSCGGVRAAEPPRPGWPGVFPELTGYACQFQEAVVGKGRTKAYRQTAAYEWTGGDLRSLKVTLARGPDFKRGAPEKSEQFKVGKREAWFIGGVVTVALGEDRAIQLQGGGSVAGREAVLQLLKAFDLDRIATALDNPPRTDFRRDVATFRAINKGMTYRQLTEWAGEPDKDVGSGIHIMVYKLPDGGRILVGTADLVKVLYVKHEDSRGKVVDLLK